MPSLRDATVHAVMSKDAILARRVDETIRQHVDDDEETILQIVNDYLTDANVSAVSQDDWEALTQ